MRRLLHLVALLGLLAAPAAASAEPTFLFTGHGWGHGIGMAQYGAYGFAQNGWKHERILAHYYRGTELGPAPVSTIRVLLATGKRLTIASADSFRIQDASGFAAKVPAGSIELDTSLTFQGANGQRALVPPVRFLPGSAPLELGKPYRGSLVVSVADGKLQAVNRVPLERYLWGVVPGEMPSEWHMEALKVQAVAARSYALVSRQTGGNFDVFADTQKPGLRRDPLGEPADDRSRERHKGTDRALQREGRLDVLFRQLRRKDGLDSGCLAGCGSLALSRLRRRSARHDLSVPRLGPIAFTAEELRAKLGDRIPKNVTTIRVNMNDSGRAGSITAIGPNGEATIPGSEVRSKLGLRSTWFTVDMLKLRTSAARVVYGKRVTLRGRLRGLDRATLERRPTGGGWGRVSRVAKTGRFSVALRPKVTTSFRLRASRIAGPTRACPGRAEGDPAQGQTAVRRSREM